MSPRPESSPRPVFFYDPVYTDGLAPDVRFPRTRYVGVRTAFAARGLEARAELRPSPECDRRDLLCAHTEAYVDDFLAGTLSARAQRQIGLRPWSDRIVERTLKIMGGSVAATRALLSERAPIAGNLAGGTHHAFADRGGGYCVFNDLAVCASVARRDHGVKRVLIIDLDVHQGDGTAALFASEPDVFTLSIHCASNYPFRKQSSDLDVALPAGTGDDAYLEALNDVVADVFMRHRPDLTIYQAGVDPLAEDKLGKLELTPAGLRRRNACVYKAALSFGSPVLVLMGGGYAEPISHSIEALADVFEQAVDAVENPSNLQ